MINPIRLKGKPANIARYYTVGDYYTKGADEHSEWGRAVELVRALMFIEKFEQDLDRHFARLDID